MNKKKDQPLNDTLFNLCKDLLRFIDRKVIKKYISPNMAQLPKELRNPDLKSEIDKKGWTYFFKDKGVTEEEKLKDVFKDDKFLGLLQNLTNSLIVVVDFLEQNQKSIKNLEEKVKHEEEKLNSLNELKNLLNNYFDKNNENKTNSENNKNILNDQNLMTIITKIQSFNNNTNDIVTKITENEININKVNNSSSINNISNSSINNDFHNKSNVSQNNNSGKKEKNNNINLSNNKDKNNNIILNNNKNKNNNIILNNKYKNNQKSNKKLENENNDSQCLSAPFPSDINIKNVNIPIKSEPNSKDKNEIDNLIDSLQVSKFIDSSNKGKIYAIQSDESYEFCNVNKNDFKSKDKKFLNKKTEREKDAKSNEKEIIIITTSSNNKNITSEKKKGKNKKKKQNKTTEKDKNLSQIPLKEELAKLPALTPKIEKFKNREIIDIDSESKSKSKEEIKKKDIKRKAQKENSDLEIDEDLVNGLLEDSETSRKGKSPKNESIEDELESRIIKAFSPLESKNQKIKIIKDILSAIKTNDIINYNPRINGPYLIGSYRNISELPTLKYSSPIDIMYTYKDILIDKKIIDYTINNIMKDILKLNLIERSEPDEDDTKKRINVKCKSKMTDKDIISFTIIFIDIGNEQNERIINNLIFNREKINYDKKEEETKFVNVQLFLRIWRKKFKLYFLIPEILDEILKLNFDVNKSMSVNILNVFYYLYNGVNDFNFNQNQLNTPKHKLLMQNLIKSWYENTNENKKLKEAILKTTKLIDSKKFEEIFI